MKIVFFTGKGGVGKSSLAASAAWQLSQKRKVLIVSLDPAHNLGDIFNVSLGDQKYPFTGNLHLAEVDLQKRARDYLDTEINVLSSSYRYLQTLNLDSCVSILKYSPGIEEYALLTSIEEILRNEVAFDTIIFDTPPTGLTLRFLALPSITITWLDRLIYLRQQILRKRYTIRKIAGGQKKESVLHYEEKDDPLLQRLRAMTANYQAVNAVLQGESCTFVVVFNPDILSLRESERLVDGLRDLNLPLRLLVNNKVTQENAEMASKVEAVMTSLTKDVPLPRIPLSPVLAGGDGKLYDLKEDITLNL